MASELANFAREMQNFFDAVDWRRDVTVQEAAADLDVFYGTSAALEAMTRAVEAQRDGDDQEGGFWLAVFACLTAPDALGGGYVTLH
ncbi:MAG: hypothetical protein AAF318_09945 [Pseudomonadota bacterium]